MANLTADTILTIANLVMDPYAYRIANTVQLFQGGFVYVDANGVLQKYAPAGLRDVIGFVREGGRPGDDPNLTPPLLGTNVAPYNQAVVEQGSFTLLGATIPTAGPIVGSQADVGLSVWLVDDNVLAGTPQAVTDGRLGWIRRWNGGTSYDVDVESYLTRKSVR